MERSNEPSQGSGESRKRLVITSCEVTPVDTHGFGSGVRGLVTITLNNALVLRSLRVMKDREDKLSVAYPALQGRDKTWYSLVEAKSDSLREEIERHVLGEYHRAVKELEAAAEASEVAEVPETSSASAGESQDSGAGAGLAEARTGPVEPPSEEQASSSL